MKKLLASLLFLVLTLLAGRSLVLHHVREESRREVREDLPHSLRELHAFATAEAQADRRYTAYLCFKVLEPFQGKAFTVTDRSVEEDLPPRMLARDGAHAEAAEARIAEWLRREGEPLTSFLLLLVGDARVPAGVRAIVIRLLYRLCPERLKGPLVELASRPFRPEEAVAMWEAAVYLGYVGGDRAAEALEGLVDRMENWGRQYAILSLKRLGALEAVPSIEKALKDPCDAVRRHACRALGVFGQRRSIPALEALLTGETDELARRFARDALAKIRKASLP